MLLFLSKLTDRRQLRCNSTRSRQQAGKRKLVHSQLGCERLVRSLAVDDPDF